MSDGTPAENLKRAMDERALLVRALRALATVSAGIPEDADPFDSPDLWIGASGLLACRSVLSDPLAVALLKEGEATDEA